MYLNVLGKEAQIERVRRNWKRKLRSVYKEISLEVSCKLATTVDDCIDVRVSTEYRLATFILMKKLESKGYRCTLERNRIDWRRGRCEDILDIYFD